MSQSNRHVLIIAGGAGTRLWPLSRNNNPKQFQKLAGELSLIQHMAALAEQVVPIDHISVMTVEQFATTVQEQLPQLPQENILTEPSRRDTGPAITLAMLTMAQRYPEATVAFVWSDHLIQDSSAFKHALEASFAAAEERPEYTIMCGANPTSPETGFGYIKMGREIAQYNGTAVFEVQQFIEKPDLATAQKFVSSWEYLWNVGYHTVNVASFLSHFREANPDLTPQLEKLEAALKENKRPQISEVYETFPKISIDYLYTQKQTKILVVPADMGWSDVGNWNILHDVLKTPEKDMVTQGPVESVTSSNNLVIAKDRTIALVGVHDLVVVDTGDSVLIMHKSAAQDMKALNAKLAETNPELL